MPYELLFCAGSTLAGLAHVIETEHTRHGWDGLPPDPFHERISQVIDDTYLLCSCGYRCTLPSAQGGRAACRAHLTESGLPAIEGVVLLVEGCRRVAAGPSAISPYELRAVIRECLVGWHHPVGYVSTGETLIGALVAGVELHRDRHGDTRVGLSRRDLRVLMGSRTAAARRSAAGLPALWCGPRGAAGEGVRGFRRNPAQDREQGA